MQAKRFHQGNAAVFLGNEGKILKLVQARIYFMNTQGEWTVLADLGHDGAQVKVAQGGKSGRGNKQMPRGKLAGTRESGTL